MPIQVPVTQTGLERSIQQAAEKAGKNLRINMGPGARSIESLAKPLGRLTGKADEFTKSMEAANARVLAFGASVGVIAAVSNGFQELVKTTIQVEKSLANINSILKQSESQLSSFKNTIFDVARNTEQTFDTVAEAALELSRQGLKAEEVTKRLNDALVLSRLSGLSAADSVAGLTAAINSFSSAGLTSSEVLNKISAAAASAAVSDRDLIEGLKRSGSVAVAAGVQFDELVGIIAALQERTARGGSVIGNSLKTIFTRIQDLDRLQTLQNLGVQVTDLGGKVLSSNKIIENLAPTFAKLNQAAKVNLADELVGKFQIAPFLALLEDYNQKISRSSEVATTSFNATNEAYERNAALNQTLAAAINSAVVNLKELGNTLGEIGVTENLKNILDFFNNLVSNIKGVLDGEGVGADLAKGLVKGLGAVLSGPGLALVGAVIGKLLIDFSKFGMGALKTFFGLNKAAERQAALQGQIAASLLNDKSIRSAILDIEKQNISQAEKKRLQTEFFTKALNEQLAVMQKMQGIARTVAPGVMAGTASKRGGRAAGGFLPIGAEKSDIARGVGGAPSSAKPVVIPNFAFGGGQRGTMVANTSEYIVPNYANGGDAIFNQNMVSSMGLPANAKKVRAASGYVPNFASTPFKARNVNKNQDIVLLIGTREQGDEPNRIVYASKTDKGSMRYSAYEDAEYEKNLRLGNPAYQIHVPTYSVAPNKKGDPPFDTSTLSDQLSAMVGEEAIKNLLTLPGGEKAAKEKGDFLRKYVKPSSMNATSGLMFEGIIQSFLQGSAFDQAKNLKSNTRLDLPLDDNLRNLFGIKPGIGAKGAEAKYSGDTKHVKSAADKIFDVLIGRQGAFGSTDLDKFKIGGPGARALGKGVSSSTKFGSLSDAQKKVIRDLGAGAGRGAALTYTSAASGYIPNFAQGALEEAIGREQSAGLPISQIRINQSGKLRNSQNPMGLAVTNTRDEPTGAIPNFADPWNKGVKKSEVIGAGYEYTKKGVEDFRKSLENATDKVDDNAKAQSNSLGIIFGVQAGLTALSAATKDSESAFARYTSIVSDSMATATSYVFAGQAVSEFGNGLKDSKPKIGAFISGLGTIGAGVGLAVEGFNLAKNVMAEYTGENVRVNKALAKLADSSGKLSRVFDKLGKEQQFEVSQKAESVLGRRGIGKVIGTDEALIKTALDYNKRMEEKGGSKAYVVDEAAGTVRQYEARSFEGGGEESEALKQGFLNTIKSLLAMEMSMDEIDKELDKFGTELTGADLSKFQSFADKTERTLTETENKLAKFLSGADENLFAGLQSFGQNTGLIQNDPAMAAFKNMPKTAFQDILKQEGQAREEKKQEGKNLISTMNSQQAKALLDTELKLAELRISGLSDEEKLFEKAKARGELTRQEIRDTERKIELNKVDQDFGKTTIGFIRERVEAVKGVALSEEKVATLMGKIGKLSLDDLQKREEVEKVLNSTEGLTGKQEELYKKLVEQVLKQYDGATKVHEQTKKAKDEALGLKDATAVIKDNFADAAESARHLARMDSLSSLADLETTKSSLEAEAQRLARISSAGGLTIGQSENLQRMQKENSLQLARTKLDELEISHTEKLVNLRQELESAGEELAIRKQNEIKEAEEAYANEKKALENSLERLEAEKNIVTAMEKANNELARLNKASGASPAMRFQAQMKVNALTKFPGLTEAEAVARYEETMSADEYRRYKYTYDAAKSASDLGKRLVDASETFRENFAKAFAEGIDSVDSLKDALLNVANTYIKSIAQAHLQNFTEKSRAGGGGGGGIFSSLISFLGFSNGGKVNGGSGNRDDVPAMLMGGEYVMNKKAVSRYGVGFMEALNSGSIRGYANGGQVRDREGMFTTPGVNGAGAIIGGSNLMSYATQTPIALGRDTITGYGAFLGSESGRMTMFGRRNNPAFQNVQAAKRQAFDLAIKEQEAYAQAASQRTSLGSMLASAAISTLVGYGASKATGSQLLGSGLGNIAGTLATGAPSSGGVFGAAAIDEGAFSALFTKKNATGGFIPASAGVDTVPAMLSGGEFVMNAAATKNIGVGNLQALNSGAGAGDNSELVSKLDELIRTTENSQSTGEINITINGSTGSESQTAGRESTEQQRNLSEKIKTAVKQVLADEQRLGGQLRR